ncbi:hypothetical protein RQM65_07365 [Pricia sp. S334]|uniref:DUF3592 domain-containing protein n=1 Tax=Pricia mediterranea TaxID=3076079 RepID=A0ABU3L407_9FLAO|nr:hypothetical protein [Pricia sp. S334]MDT7828476.1 hypothetical protein [Pricia sp. S334]
MTITRNQYVGIGVVITVLVLFYTFYEYRKWDIERNSHQTIAQVNGYLRGTKTGPSLKYFYRDNDSKYDGSIYIESEKYPAYKNRFFIVNYSAENPSWSEILLSRPVTDTPAIKAAGFRLPKKKTNQFQQH